MSLIIQNTLFSNKTLAKNSGNVGPAATNRVLKSFSGLRASQPLPRQGLGSGLPLISQTRRTHFVQGNRSSRHGVYALFEKFIERSIKSVMLAQEWARNNGELEASNFKLLHIDSMKRPNGAYF